jgi:hypothetical protein
LQVCLSGALSPARGRVCRLQLLLALASAVIFVTIFYCLRFETSLFRRFLRLSGLRWRYSKQPPHGILVLACSGLIYGSVHLVFVAINSASHGLVRNVGASHASEMLLPCLGIFLRCDSARKFPLLSIHLHFSFYLTATLRRSKKISSHAHEFLVSSLARKLDTSLTRRCSGVEGNVAVGSVRMRGFASLSKPSNFKLLELLWAQN